MRKIAKWKMISLLLIVIIFLIRITYIFVGGEINKKYFVSQEVDLSDAIELPCNDITANFISNQKYLNSVDVVFSGISDDKLGRIVFKILSGEQLIYQTNISLSAINNYEWKHIFINAPLTKDEYSIYLDATDDCTQIPNILVTSYNSAAPEIVSSYIGPSEINGQVAIQYGFLQAPHWLDKCVVSSLWFIFLLIAGLFLYHYEWIRESIKKFLKYIYKNVNQQFFSVAAEIFFCLIIVNCSGIKFQESTKITLYFISIFSAIKEHEHRHLINGICGTSAKKILLFVLYFYGAFSLVGQRILAYPLDLEISVAGLFVFIVAILWFIPVIQTVLYLLDKINSTSRHGKHYLGNISFSTIIVLLLLLPAAYNLFANNPGISSPDTVDTMATMAHHLHGNSDWHPFFYCAVLRIILNIWDSTYAVIAVQYFFWVYVMLEFLFYLREKGVKDNILVCTALFTGFNASNILYINTIWKDIPYALSLLWLLLLLAKLSIDFKRYQKKWYIYWELIIALVGVFFYRKNGIVPFIVAVIMALFVLRKNIKIWCTFIVVMLIIIVIKGPVYSYFDVINTGRTGIYIGLGQEILGTYYAGGEVSEDTLQMINTMTDFNIAERPYTPSYANQVYEINIEPSEFIYHYIDTFVKNPVLMLRALINREDVLWDIYAGEGSTLNLINFHEAIDNTAPWNDYYPQRIYVSLYDTMENIVGYAAKSQWISAIEWRCGLFTLLGLIALVYMVLKNGINRYILITAPIIGQILSLLLSTGWADFRYFWPLNLMNMYLLLFAITLSADNMENIKN